MFTIKVADKKDNEGLLHLTRLCPMEGTIPLLIDRTPDFFLLPAERGKSITLIATNPVDDTVIGSFTASIYTGFIDGKEEQILYVSDLKVHPDFRKQKVALALLRAMDGYVRKRKPGIVFCVLAGGNAAVFRFFQMRSGFPEFLDFGRFHVLQIFPKSWGQKTALKEIQEVDSGPLHHQLIEFYNETHRSLELAPVVQDRNLITCRNFVVLGEKKIRAAISLIDPAPFKQNIVLDLPVYLKILAGIFRAAGHFLPLADLPKTGEPIRTLFLRTYGCLPGAEDALRSLIHFARKLAYREGYNFLSAGIHERNPALGLFKSMPGIDFISHLYIADFNLNKQNVNAMIERGIPFMDYSIV